MTEQEIRNIKLYLLLNKEDNNIINKVFDNMFKIKMYRSISDDDMFFVYKNKEVFISLIKSNRDITKIATYKVIVNYNILKKSEVKLKNILEKNAVDFLEHIVEYKLREKFQINIKFLEFKSFSMMITDIVECDISDLSWQYIYNEDDILNNIKLINGITDLNPDVKTSFLKLVFEYNIPSKIALIYFKYLSKKVVNYPINYPSIKKELKKDNITNYNEFKKFVDNL
jgi:hypothetical protein